MGYRIDFFPFDLVLHFELGITNDFKLIFNKGNFLPVETNRILYLIDFRH